MATLYRPYGELENQVGPHKDPMETSRFIRGCHCPWGPYRTPGDAEAPQLSPHPPDPYGAATEPSVAQCLPVQSTTASQLGAALPWTSMDQYCFPTGITAPTSAQHGAAQTSMAAQLGTPSAWPCVVPVRTSTDQYSIVPGIFSPAWPFVFPVRTSTDQLGFPAGISSHL